MTNQEKYIKALSDLLTAQEAVQQETENPFNLGLPTHLGLPQETFISDDELEELRSKINQASEDHLQFAKLWNLGSDFILKAKAIFL